MIEALTSGPTILLVLAGLAAFAVAVVAIKIAIKLAVRIGIVAAVVLAGLYAAGFTDLSFLPFCRPPAYCAVRSRNTPAAPRSRSPLRPTRGNFR